MAHIHALVAENTPHLIDTLHAAYDQPLQIQLRGNTQVHVDIQGIVMSDERPCRRAAGNSPQHRGLNLKEVTLIQIITDGLHDIGASHKGIHNLRIHNQIHITLAIADFRICQAVELLRQRTQGLGQKVKIIHTDGNLAPAGAENLALYTDNIANIQKLELGILLLPQHIQLEINLDAAAAVHQHGKACLAMAADCHQAACDSNFFLALNLALKVLKLLQHLIGMVRNLKTVAKRSHSLCLKGCQLIPAHLQKLIHILFNNRLALILL